jgi:hypothetical protein
MNQELKDKILKLRKEGNGYVKIAKKLDCSKSIVSYHCRMNNLGGEIKNSLTEQERKERNYLRVKSHRQKIKQKAIKYKGGKCEKWGYDKCEWALDFHHLDKNQKEFSLAQYLVVAWERVQRELDKCILICSNCHRELHYEEFLEKMDF